MYSGFESQVSNLAGELLDCEFKSGDFSHVIFGGREGSVEMGKAGCVAMGG